MGIASWFLRVVFRRPGKSKKKERRLLTLEQFVKPYIDKKNRNESFKHTPFGMRFSRIIRIGDDLYGKVKYLDIPKDISKKGIEYESIRFKKNERPLVNLSKDLEDKYLEPLLCSGNYEHYISDIIDFRFFVTDEGFFLISETVTLSAKAAGDIRSSSFIGYLHRDIINRIIDNIDALRENVERSRIKAIVFRIGKDREEFCKSYRVDLGLVKIITDFKSGMSRGYLKADPDDNNSDCTISIADNDRGDDSPLYHLLETDEKMIDLLFVPDRDGDFILHTVITKASVYKRNNRTMKFVEHENKG